MDLAEHDPLRHPPLEPGTQAALMADAYYTRRQRWHVLLGPAGQPLRAESELGELLQQALAMDIRSLTIIDSDYRPLLVCAIAPITMENDHE